MKFAWTPLILTFGMCGADWQESFRLGPELVRQGRFAEALPHLRQVLGRLQPTDPLVPEALKLLGRANQQLGRYAEAERAYKRALARFRPADPPDPRVVVLWSNLLALYLEQSRPGPAAVMAARLLNLNPGQLPADPDDLRHLHTNLAGYHALRREYADAESMLLRALAVAGAASSELQAEILNNLGALASLTGRSGAAVDYLERAAARAEHSMGSRHPMLAKVLTNLALAYDQVARAAEADAALNRAWSVAGASLPEFHRLRAEILSAQAGMFRRRGHKDDARRLEARARVILERLRAEDGGRYSVDVSELRRTRP